MPPREHLVDADAFATTFRRLFDEQFPSLFRYLDRLSGDPELAADLAQEAFVRLYQRGALPDDARAWLASVAANLLRDERRRSARRARLLDTRPDDVPLGSVPAADAGVVEGERRALARAALDALPPRDRDMLLLKHEGYSYREIARAVGVAESSVGTLLARATAAFRRVIEGRGHVSA
jgi:RNA polymerase sigma-70 factor (ECF subfamily)